MRYERAEVILRLALAMQGTREGLSLTDIGERFGVARRTAERLRDAVERLFPQMERTNPFERPKRWRIPAGTLNGLVHFTAEELADLHAAVAVLRRDNREGEAITLERLAEKLRTLSWPDALRRIEPDLEAYLEAEGLALRPGPRPQVRQDVLSDLRQAILGCCKVRLYYRARMTGKLSRQIVCPYGFLYGNRHYLIAYGMNPQARDYRMFSLSNIERAEILEYPFERRRDFSLKDYAERAFGVFQEEPFEVVWKFSAEAAVDAREFRFHPTQTMEEQADGSLLVRFRAGGAREMCWHLFTWGEHVEVVEPRDLWKRAGLRPPRFWKETKP
jgi:predicted DNA-binding transcriptional regulator YafY